MSDGLSLALLVAASTVVWPLNRWALRHGATPVGIGIVLSAVALAGGIVGALAMGQPLYEPTAFFYGALGGIAYAVGFSLFILRCLAAGPVAPTVAAHGLGVAGAVLASLFVPYASSLSGTGVGGFAATLTALGILGLAPMLKPGAEGRRDRQWATSAVAGWAFMALSSATQFLSGWFAPSSPFGYIVAQKLVSLLILLLVASSRGGARLSPADLVAGGGTGILSAVLLPLSITAMAAMGGLVEYPISVAGPTALVLIGAVAFVRERLSVWGWLGCLSSLAAMVLLSLPRGG